MTKERREARKKRFLEDRVQIDLSQNVEDQKRYQDNMIYFRSLALCPNCMIRYSKIETDRIGLKITLHCQICCCSEMFETPQVKERIKFNNEFFVKYFGEITDNQGKVKGLIVSEKKF